MFCYGSLRKLNPDRLEGVTYLGPCVEVLERGSIWVGSVRSGNAEGGWGATRVLMLISTLILGKAGWKLHATAGLGPSTQPFLVCVWAVQNVSGQEEDPESRHNEGGEQQSLGAGRNFSPGKENETAVWLPSFFS